LLSPRRLGEPADQEQSYHGNGKYADAQHNQGTPARSVDVLDPPYRIFARRTLVAHDAGDEDLEASLAWLEGASFAAVCVAEEAPAFRAGPLSRLLAKRALHETASLR
jgi:hypothetical protein